MKGLRAHDERIIHRLMLTTRTSSGEPTNVVELDPGTPEPTAAGHMKDGRTDDRDQEHDQEQQDEQEREDRDESVTGVPLLRFSQPRDPAAIARWLRTRVLQPDSEVWLTGYEALRQWVTRHGDAHVPTGAVIHLEEPVDGREGYPVGQWASEQRRALADGVLRPHRYQLLDELGMVWDVADARFQNGLTAARAYFEEFGTLAAPRDAVIDGFAIGQWLENLRKGVMVVTEKRDSALREIDPYWNPAWPVAWQRGYAALAYLLQEEEGVPEVPPGVRVHGIDVGTWLRRQTTPAGWGQLAAGQRELLEQLGVQPPTGAHKQRDAVAPVVPGLEGLDAFGRGLAAARQYLAREGHLTVPRGHEEMLQPAEPDGTPVTVRLGVWLSNQKSRRGKLTHERREALADLGLEWAKRP